MNYKVKVENEAESKEVQELFFALGYHWYYNGKQKIENVVGFINSNKDMSLTSGSVFNNEHKELTIPQLKDLVVLKRNSIDELKHRVNDKVNNPSHYSDSAIECIDAMEAMLSPQEFIGYLRGNMFKYQWRYQKKNGIEDLQKSEWYLKKLIEKEMKNEDKDA